MSQNGMPILIKALLGITLMLYKQNVDRSVSNRRIPNKQLPEMEARRQELLRKLENAVRRSREALDTLSNTG